jgi:putative heme transporter
MPAARPLTRRLVPRPAGLVASLPPSPKVRPMARRPSSRRSTPRPSAVRLRSVRRPVRAAARTGSEPHQPVVGITLKAFRVGFVGALGVGLGLAVLTGLDTISSLLTYIGVAYFFALALEPALSWAVRHGVRRPAAVALAFAALIVLAAAVVFAIVPAVTAQFESLVEGAPKALKTLVAQPWFDDLAKQFGLSSTLDGTVDSVTDFLKKPAHLQSIGGGLLSVGSGLLDGVAAVFVVLVLTVYFAATLPRMTASAFRLMAASKAARFRPVYDEMTHSVGRYVAGQVLLAAINATLTCLLLVVFHVPGVVLLTAIAFIGALVPIIGTAVEAVVIITVSLFASPAAAIAAIIFFVVYHPLEAYVIAPRILSRAVHVSGALVVIAVVGGAALGGILGALVAVPTVAAASVLIERVVVPRQARL